ncbi:MAG: hypothetical protein ACE14L_17745 [Terriglobales bacterium]
MYETMKRLMIRPSLALALILIASGVCLGQGDLSRARQMLHAFHEERQQAAETGTSSEFTIDYIDGRLKTIEAELNSALASMLAGPARPACGDVQEDLRSALGHEGHADPNVASAVCIEREGKVYYVVGYSLAGAATYSRSWIGVFGPSVPGGQYRMLSAVDNSLPSKTIALWPKPLQMDDKIVVLAYGVNWGDAHNRLTVIAYSFDGHTLNPIWSRSDLPQGQIKIEGRKIKLTFLSSLLGPGYKSVHEIRETYRVTSSGITLEKRSTGVRG